ncbi:MAG: lysophospholipid acyltransferase family protein [Phycisphaerales bacterium]|nr:lysophospholipid acyltransferase family protein [Phycisphaerales bacterium]
MPRRRAPRILGTPMYVGIRTAIAALGAGDLAGAVHTAQLLGEKFALAPFNRKRLSRGIENLAVAFPGWPEEKRRAYTIRSYQHLFTLAVEMSYTPRLMSEDTWSDHVRIGNLGQAVRCLLSERPCVMVTGHCGNWELLGYTIALLGFPVRALYRPLDLPPLDRWARRTRARRGLIMLDKFGAMRELPEVMVRAEPVGFVADQNGGDRGLFVPFFNRLASTYKSVGLLAQQHDAPILCGQARRLVWDRDGAEENVADPLADGGLGFQAWNGEPFRYRIDVIDIITPEQYKAQPDPLFYITARYRRAIEQMVRRAPEQNLWMHRFWKSRPRHERLGKPFPPALLHKIRELPWITEGDVERILEWSRRDALTAGKAKHRREPGELAEDRIDTEAGLQA